MLHHASSDGVGRALSTDVLDWNNGFALECQGYRSSISRVLGCAFPNLPPVQNMTTVVSGKPSSSRSALSVACWQARRLPKICTQQPLYEQRTSVSDAIKPDIPKDWN